MKPEVFDLGLIDFQKAYDFQKEIFGRVKNGKTCGALILCRHNPVVTLGRSANKNNLLVSAEELKAKGIRVYALERGGDITYHGPGQLTLYPVLDLRYLKKDIHWFLRKMESAIIGFLADFGVEARQRVGFTGAWIGQRKIASIGIAIRNWITFHGLSVNIEKNDLKNFELIRPCGMDIKMISLEEASGRVIDSKIAAERIIWNFRRTLDNPVLINNRQGFNSRNNLLTLKCS
ncbi:MAG: lipoyl(octanoyl) transferase LipB [Candidatus Omnitrophica bacterium]|nr:lipoyl(octanoyl) transferase LipB [Candidatus Omnitrophota bacterium]